MSMTVNSDYTSQIRLAWPDSNYSSIGRGWYLSGDTPLMTDLCSFVSTINEQGIQEQVQAFVAALSRSLKIVHIDDELPEIFTDLIPGNAYLEWAFGTFRFGFSFVSDPMESEWFLIPPEDDIREGYRYFIEGKYQDLTDFVLRYIRSNA